VTVLVLILGACGLLVVALALGRSYSHRGRLMEWHDALGGDAEQSIAGVLIRVDMDQACIDDAMKGARRAMETSALVDAVRLLQLAAHVVEGATNSRLGRLRGMAQATRMAVALFPMPAVPSKPLRLPSTKTVAFLARILHPVLVSAAERLWLRTRVLMVGLWLTGRVTRKTVDALSIAPTADHLWQRLDRALADRSVLDVEHVATFRVLLASLAQGVRGSATTPAHR
jgi:hypothetical protein